MRPSETLTRFDRYLAERSLSFEAVIIGGAALALLGVVSRQTRDCDILHPELPEDIAAASRAFADDIRQAGDVLDDHWLNNGPASLTRSLPQGWQDRLQVVFTGQAIKLYTLGRMELLMSKLFALCDRGIDLGDCLALGPAPAELAEIIPWLSEQDGNPDWPAHVRATLDDLQHRLGHAL